MDKITQRVLRRLRKIHSKISPQNHQRTPPAVDCEGRQASDRIRELLGRDHPCMICRFGGTETPVIVTHLSMTDRQPFLKKAAEFIQGKRERFWWDPKVKSDIFNFSGFFPTTDEMLVRYSVETLEDMKQIDLLGSWLAHEKLLKDYLPPHVIRVPLFDLEPFHQTDPWTEVLAGKKVLVVHPFEESIRQQYAKRKLLFQDPRLLPDFELKTLKSVQSLVGNEVEFSDWFAALDSMRKKMDAIDFDIAIIGAGAYGFPLAAHARRRGKKAIHLGGVTQMLFGIRGKRWDDSPEYQNLFNEHWVRPQQQEAPKNFRMLERGAYW